MSLANYVYDRVIDYIENRARDNEIRELYARYMSAQNYNNNEMNKVVDVVMIAAEAELENARTQREEEDIIREIAMAIVDAHAGAFAMSDRDIVNAVPDDVYHEMQRLEDKWKGILHRLQGGTAGSRRGNNSFGDRGGQSRRSVFAQERDTSFGRRGGVFGDDDPRGQQRASNSVFSSIDNGRNAVFEREPRDNSREEARRPGFGQSAASMRGADVARTDSPEPLHRKPEPVVEEKNDGPDYTTDRPYDNFWVNGENWQLAHTSKFQWSWSPKQHTRRTYNPEQEVCFLVKGTDGAVREEFLAVTDDLVEYAHEIRSMTRPNESRRFSDRDSGDDLFPSNDLDVVDLDKLHEMEQVVRAHAFADFKAKQVHQLTSTEAVATLDEATLQVSAAATKHDDHVTTAARYISVLLPGDQETLTALDSLKSLSEDADLLLIQKRLQTLRGHISENVMNYLDNHYTHEVNRAVSDQFGLAGLAITSFIEDFEDLVNCKRFKNFGAGYSAQFLARTRPICLSLVPIIGEKERLEVLDCTDVLPVAEEDPEAYRKYRENIVLFFKPMAVVHVKLNSEDLGLVDSTVRTPAAKGEQAVLAQVLVDLYSAGREASATGRVYLMTADHLCFELVPISGARNIVGIRTA